jgi:ppGpp synthetase/RelA/SpoT-type nucleotidyltranferase
MAKYAVPQYTRSQVDAAGAMLINPPPIPDADEEWNDEYEDAWRQYDETLATINNWRSSHSFPLNTFQVTLKRKAQQIDANALLAQRIKRLSSIRLKLRRFPAMRLSQMQDIGGCRAIVQSVSHIDALVSLYKQSDLKHKLVNTDDYVRKPQASGYRGVHLIYRYYSDRKQTYNDLKVEMQFRSPLQHAWATTVETVGTFTRQALKSSLGEEKWLRFFALMGTAISNREETPPVPGTPTAKKELVEELRDHANSLEVEAHLRAYGEALRNIEESGIQNAHYFLLTLDTSAQRVSVTGFRANEFEQASEAYLATERSISENTGQDAVLVSVDSVESLRRAYPNYFLDTRVFIDVVREALAA